MTAEPEATLKRVAAFLGAAGDVAWRHDMEARNISAERIRTFPLKSLVVDNPVATMLRRTLVPRSLRDRVKAKLQMRERPALSDETIRRLRDSFAEDALLSSASPIAR
jgi:hypothetical protein